MDKEIKRIEVPFLVTKEDMIEGDMYFTFKGYASTFGNIDRDGDTIEQGAFKKSLEKFLETGNKLPILWQHEMDMPLGIYTRFTEDDKGLLVEGKMPKADNFVSGRVIPQMRIGSVRKMSIGFRILEKEYQTIDGRNIRVIKEVELFEVSLVTIPANNEADITGMKSFTVYNDLPLAELKTIWNKEDALGRVRVLTNSTAQPNCGYNKAFLNYDIDKKSLYSSYTLAFADVIEDQIKAVPEAIFEVAKQLMTEKYNSNINPEDRLKIITNINKYYAKMRKQFEDADIISPFEEDTAQLIKTCTKLSDVESIFKKHFFSNKESQMIISKIAELKRLGDQAAEDSQNDDVLANELTDILSEFKTINIREI